MLKYTILLLPFFLAGCIHSEKKALDEGETIIVRLSDEIEPTLKDSTVFESCQTIRLETTEQSLIRAIDRLYVEEDLIFILDDSQDKLFIFNQTGKFINSINNKGNGPKEYQSIIDFCVNKADRQIILLCDRPYKIMKFDFAGNFITENNHDKLYTNIAHANENYFFQKSESYGEGELVVMDNNFSIIQEDLESRPNRDRVFHKGRTLNVNEEIYFSRPLENIIYKIENGKVINKYSFDFGAYAVPNHINQRTAYASYIHSISNVVDNNNFLMLQTNKCILVYFKKTGTAEAYETILNTEFGMGTNTLITTGDNKHIGLILQPEHFKRMEEKYTSGEKFENWKALDFSKSLTKDDNPILLLYSFK